MGRRRQQSPLGLKPSRAARIPPPTATRAGHLPGYQRHARPAPRRHWRGNGYLRPLVVTHTGIRPAQWLSLENSALPGLPCARDGSMGRSRHPNKEIEGALEHAEDHRWRVEQGGSHAWGKIKCPFNDGACGSKDWCMTSVWSTPQSPEIHARQLRRVVDRCVRAHPPPSPEAESADSEE